MILFFLHATAVGRIACVLSAMHNGLFITFLLMAPHGIFELAGFLLAATSLLSVLFQHILHLFSGRPVGQWETLRNRFVRTNAVAVTLLICAAFIETYVTPDLCLWTMSLFHLH